REVDDQRHVHAESFRTDAEDTADRPDTLVARDEHDRIRHAVLPRGQHGRVHDHPREEPRPAARLRPLAARRATLRAERAGRMPPRAAVQESLKAELMRARRGPVRYTVLAPGPPYELALLNASSSRILSRP